MIWILIIGLPMIAGYAIAEVIHRWSQRRVEETRRINDLKAEFLDRQMWQFISIDEWLAALTKEGDKA